MALNLNDLTSSANNLTNNGATDITSSLPFSAVTHAAQVVAASSQYLTAADANQLSIATTGKLTIEFWIKLQALNNNNHAVWKGNAGQYEYEFIVGNTNGAVEFCPFNLAGTPKYDHLSANSIVTTGVWYHVAASVDDTLAFAQSNVQMYVDEVEKTNTTAGANNALANGTSPLDIGRRTDTLVFGDFQIAELRFWNTVRTPTQLTNNKNISLVGNESGLVAYYPFYVPVYSHPAPQMTMMGVGS